MSGETVVNLFPVFRGALFLAVILIANWGVIQMWRGKGTGEWQSDTPWKN